MTPQERQLVADLFDRLSSLESTPRDPEAERLIADGAARAPHALYALVQTVLVQDEALKRAEAHIRQLEGEAEPQGGSFLDSMRSAIFGGAGQPASRGSVPSVPSAGKWNAGQAAGGYQANAAPSYGQQSNGQPYEQPSRGGSFLGTAAAAAAGVIGGSMLFNGLSSMMGGNRGQAFASPAERGSPWGGEDSSGSLARDAGVNDIGDRGGARGDAQPAGLFGNDDGNGDDDSDYDDGDFDSGFGDDISDA